LSDNNLTRPERVNTYGQGITMTAAVGSPQVERRRRSHVWIAAADTDTKTT